MMRRESRPVSGHFRDDRRVCSVKRPASVETLWWTTRPWQPRRNRPANIDRQTFCARFSKIAMPLMVILSIMLLVFVSTRLNQTISRLHNEEAAAKVAEERMRVRLDETESRLARIREQMDHLSRKVIETVPTDPFGSSHSSIPNQDLATEQFVGEFDRPPPEAR